MTDNNLNIDSDDKTLIKAFNDGNQNAFNFIVRKYQKKIYWIIRKMVLNHDDADDLTQEVFLKLYKSLKDFRGESSFFTYVYRISINYSLNHLNKNKKIMAKKVDFEKAQTRIPDKKTEYDLDAIQRTKILEEAIKSLPEQQRAVFNMRYYDNLSYEEISIILNKSIGGMKANYFHAIKKIEKYLKSNKYFEAVEAN